MTTRPLFSWSVACRRDAFTLVEMLVVLSIIAILAVGTISAIQPVLESSSLTEGGQVFVGQVSLARQLAAARNCTVQVRLIPTSATAQGYGAIQLWGAPSGGSSTAMSRMVFLPQSVVIAQDKTKLSPMLANAATGQMTLPTATVNYTAFGIAPEGLVEIGTGTAGEVSGASASSSSTMASLYVSIVPARFATSATAPPNYVTVQLNPNTGAALVFRP